MTDVFSLLTENIGQYLLYAILIDVFVIAFRICFMLSIGFDCKSKSNKKQAMWMILCFFFPIVAGIIYACTRNKEVVNEQKVCTTCGTPLSESDNFCNNCGNSSFVYAENSNSTKHNKTSKVLFAVSVVLFVVYLVLYILTVVNMTSYILNYDTTDSDYYSDYYDFDYDYETHYGYTLNGKTVYYDKNGNAYDDDDDVLYYDKDNNTYTYDDEDYVFEDGFGDEFDFAYCYVDSDGYFYFDEAGYNGNSDATIYYSGKYDAYVDDDDNIYYYADEVSWDADGNLVDCYEGLPLE
jgi:predicted nucleic acid-binding Zn ribbon protein